MNDELDVPPDAERKRAVLRQVAAYRELCGKVRRSGTQSLIFGAFMLALWYYVFPQRDKFGAFGLIYLVTAGLEFTVGLWNRFRPSAEGILMDGLVLGVFGTSTLARQYLLFVANGPRPTPFMVVFGALWLYQGFNHVRWYLSLRRAFAVRPTAEHLRWFSDLLYEIQTSDPESDPQALDLPGRPRVRAKLLGDTALFLVGDPDHLLIADRSDVELDRIPAEDPDRLPDAELAVEGQYLGRFRLHPENWRNYAAWKAEGGDPPTVHPIR